MLAPVYVILAVDHDAVSGVAQSALREVTKLTNVRFRPLHPGVEETEMGRFYISENVDDKTASRLIDELRRVPGIEAAYTKPPDEAP
jgi:hypothetical protein